MRYVLAILALALSGVLLLLGFGQRTFLAGPSEIAVPISLEDDTRYALIDGGEFSKIAGQANIVMRGSSSVAVIANTRDADGWLEPFDHVNVTVDPETRQAVTRSVRGVDPQSELIEVDDNGAAVPLDPRGSDLWLETSTGEDGPIRLPVAPRADQSIMIASDGESGIPAGAAIVWVQDRSTPLAGPLLVAGGLFALLGAVLYLLAFDRDRRSLGPRRGRKGPLLGVRNVIGGRSRRASAGPVGDADPKRGVLSTAPALPRGKDAGSDAEEPERHSGEPGGEPPSTTAQEEGNDAAH